MTYILDALQIPKHCESFRFKRENQERTLWRYENLLKTNL